MTTLTLHRRAHRYYVTTDNPHVPKWLRRAPVEGADEREILEALRESNPGCQVVKSEQRDA